MSTKPILLRRSEVLARVGVSRGTLYRMIRAGQFPAPRQLGARAVAWPEAEITAWIESRTVSAHWAASAV